MFVRKLWKLKHVGQCVGHSLLLYISAIFLMQTHTHAAEQITLISNGREVTVSVADLQAFMGDRQTSAELQQFLEQPGSIETIRSGLDARIPLNSTSLEQNFSSPTDQFVLIQLDQIMGTHFRQENLEPLQTALVTAYEDDQHFSLAELIEQYPEPEVRVDVSRLMQVYGEIQPIMAIVNNFLPELACNCTAPISSNFDWSQSPEAQPMATNNVKRELSREVADCTVSNLASHLTSQSSYSKQNLENSTRLFSGISQELILTYGPLRPSFSVGDLEALAENGEAPGAWSIYLSVANIEPENIQAALTQEITIEAQLLDQVLNSIVGEYALFQLGQILHTRSGRANIQALRASVMQSVLDDNRISLLEFLQNYPLSQVYVDGSHLIQLSRQFNRITNTIIEAESNYTEGSLAASQDWLVGIQTAATESLCECNEHL